MKYRELLSKIESALIKHGLDQEVNYSDFKRVLDEVYYGEQKFYSFKGLPIVKSDEQVLVWYGKDFCGRTRKGVQPTEDILLKLICDDCGFYVAEVKCCFDTRVKLLIKEVLSES